jgi:hypothetical protein
LLLGTIGSTPYYRHRTQSVFSCFRGLDDGLFRGANSRIRDTSWGANARGNTYRHPLGFKRISSIRFVKIVFVTFDQGKKNSAPGASFVHMPLSPIS